MKEKKWELLLFINYWLPQKVGPTEEGLYEYLGLEYLEQGWFALWKKTETYYEGDEETRTRVDIHWQK